MQYRGNTAAEIIYNRADHKKEHMGLTSWEGAPDSKIHKYDVVIAKNYLSETEIGQLERMVFLGTPSQGNFIKYYEIVILENIC